VGEIRVAVLQFPGTNCDYDVYHALARVLGVHTELIWHTLFRGDRYDAVILPGGFSYGDYLRAGAIAAHSPAMDQVREMAKEGKPVLGICNGFQILTEAELLPGSLLPNDHLRFICKWIRIRVETTRTAFSNQCQKGQVLHIPIAHNEGRFFVDDRTLKELVENEQVVFRYVDERGEPTPEANPNGSVSNIAGVCNLEGNVVGLMPHPERASEPILSPFNSNDGLLIFFSMLNYISRKT